MERAEAEAIYDAGREGCVEILLRFGELEGRLDKLDAENRRLKERVADLEERLRQSSRNSSLPPSADPPAAPPRPGKRASGRRPGGQPGHEGRHRPLLPLERVDEVVEHWPERCRACAHVFGADERIEVAAPQRHQVAELPPIAVSVSEHRLHRLRCPQCARETRAQLRPELASSAFGPRLEAAIATLSVRNRVSRRDATELVRELFGAELSLGSVDAIVSRAGEALALPYQELLRRVRCAPAVNIDETGWRLRGSKRTLWGAVTPQAAVFRVASDRHEREARALLGDDFAGVASSDRWWAYNYLDPERRQVCWSHLLRDFTAHAEGLAAQKDFGEAGLQLAERLFAAWHAFQADGDRAALKRRLRPLRRELRALLERHARKSARHKRTRTFAKNLLKLWPALWTFADTDGVEPTNNAAERALRGPVIHRKLSLGSQSENGERTIERLLSASVTCRLQHRSLFAYLADVLTAQARGDPVPSLA
jgi:transposase